MKIALIVPGFSADEGDWCIPALRDLARRLARAHELHVFALRYPHRRDRYRVAGAWVHSFGGAAGRGLDSLAVWRQALRAVWQEHQRGRFALFHAFWANEAGFLAASAGRLLGRPSLVSLAGGELVALRRVGYGGQITPLERLKVRWALEGATLVSGGSHYLLHLARAYLSPAHRPCLRWLPLGVDTARFRPGEMAAPRAIPRLLHVAALAPVKDPGTLIRALAVAQAAGQPAELRLIGGGSAEAATRALAARLGLADRVQFGGALPHDALPAVYAAADLFVFSSRHEAQGMALLEAAACGLPVVGTAVGVLPDLADPRRGPPAAVVVPVADALALGEAIVGLLRDPERRAALAAAGPARVRADYSLERAAERFGAAYRELVGDGSPSPPGSFSRERERGSPERSRRPRKTPLIDHAFSPDNRLGTGHPSPACGGGAQG